MPKDLLLPLSVQHLALVSYSFDLFPLSHLLPKPTRGSPSLPCAFTRAVECGWEQGKQHSHAVRPQFKSMGATYVSPLVLSSIWHWSVHRGNFFTGVWGHRASLPGVPALIDWDSFETMSPASLSSLTLMFSGYFAEIRRKVANPVLKGISTRANNTHVGALPLVCFLQETVEKCKCQLIIR